MSAITTRIRNISSYRRLCRRKALVDLVARVSEGEAVERPAELSILFCDDAFIQELNREYAGIDDSTDVLSFPQEPPGQNAPRLLGDIVISLETVEKRCAGIPSQVRRETLLLVCHGMLHLLGYDHATPREKAAMNTRQTEYLRAQGSRTPPLDASAGPGGQQGEHAVG